jgi:RimK family alpha-L-glutamate ligase
MVIKPKKGSKGAGVILVKDRHELENQMEFIHTYASQGELIAQEYIAGTNGEDVRVFVLNGEPIACMKRSSKDGFRSNFSQGGSVAKYPINEQIKELTKVICDRLDLNVGGIDLFESGDGNYILCEVNSSPGFAGLQQTQDFNIPEKLLKYLLSQVD